MFYDWTNKDWKVEDRQFSPKRKVNNRNSRQHPHIIGSFYSHKMELVVDYESLGERLFYYYLEMDNSVVRYYVQPVEITIHNKDGQVWNHVPDTLVFRENMKPLLYQVKHEPNEVFDEKLEYINSYCDDYVINRGWEYHVIYPKLMPVMLARNIRYLKNFLKERSYYGHWKDKISYGLICLETSTVEELSNQFVDEYHPLLLKPLIYHLIAKGVFLSDVSVVIDSNSSISFNHLMKSSIFYEGQVFTNGIQST